MPNAFILQMHVTLCNTPPQKKLPCTEELRSAAHPSGTQRTVSINETPEVDKFARQRRLWQARQAVQVLKYIHLSDTPAPPAFIYRVVTVTVEADTKT
jgi:hypothetical protein